MKTSTPVAYDPVVDALAFVLPWCVDHSSEEQARELAPLRRRLDKALKNEVCKRAYSKGGRYIEIFTIPLNGGSSAYVQIGAVRPDNQKGGIRIEVNPSRFAKGDVEYLHAVMTRIVGRVYTKLLSSPLLKRIDFAVDVHHANLDHMLVDYHHAQHRTIFGKRLSSGGRIEGYNFGSATSDYFSVAYDKKAERVHAAILNLLKYGKGSDGLKDNAIKRLAVAREAPEVMRVEVRCRKLRNVQLWDIESLPNRFARFHFADLNQDGTDVPEFVEAAFLALCEQRGVKAALARFKHTKHSSAVRRYWQSRQASWWEPDPLWAEAWIAVCEMELFPDDAFKKPKVRNLAEQQATKEKSRG